MPDARAAMAQALATEFGLPIIFLRVGDKRPRYEGQFEAQATLDPARIARELGGASRLNYGIAFGPAAGCFALDVDEGGAFTIATFEPELGPLPVTWRIKTQSGNYQDLFDWPSDGGAPIRNRGRFAPGLDVRGAGGQSVGPGSEYHDPDTGEVRTWEWVPGRAPWQIDRQPMPPAWLGLIRYHAERQPGPAPRRPAPPQAKNRLEAFAAKVMDDKLAALASAPHGEQEAKLGAAALKAGSLVASGWISRSYCEQAIVATLLGCPNYVPGDPWTYNVATYKVGRGIEKGLSSPEPNPAWVAEIEARERPPASHLTAIPGGKANGSAPPASDAPPEAAEGPDERLKLAAHVWKTPAQMPTRKWLYGKHYIRRYVSATIAPTGTGKSILALTEACAMASGKDLLGVPCATRRKVGYWNGEDPLEETERRVMAICKHHDLTPEDLAGHLFLGSGRQTEIVMARIQARGAVEVDMAMVADVIHTVRAWALDVLIIDPLVSSHRVPESDNMAMDLVAKTWGRITEACDIAVELVHHPRKTGGQEVTVEDSRGAGALVSATRSARVLNQMSEEEARSAGVSANRRFAYFRSDIGVPNLAAHPDHSTWFRFISVDLENGGPDEGLGDSVGVVTPWKWPNALEGVTPQQVLQVQQQVAAGIWRENPQAEDWVGRAVAEVLDLDVEDDAARARIRSLLKTWRDNSLLEVAQKVDAKTRKPRSFVVVGKWMVP